MTSFKLLRTTLTLLTVAIFAIAFSASIATAENSSSDSGTKSRGGGENPNIKSHSAKNDTANAPAAPKAKGGEATRGACNLLVDNSTPWKIHIYVDGEWVGMMSEWGDASGWYNSGRHNLYGVALFTDGSELTWGPRQVSCSGTYTWKLTVD